MAQKCPRIMRDIIQYILENSWFDFDGDIDDLDEDDKDLLFMTRENGCVGDEEIGQEDWDEGERVLLLVMGKYGHLIRQYNLDTTDEWVNLQITLK